MLKYVKAVYALCKKSTTNSVALLIMFVFFVTISPITIVIYYVHLAFYFHLMFVSKAKKAPEYVLYDSEYPLWSLVRYVFWSEPALRAFGVMFNLKYRRGKLGVLMSYQAIRSVVERLAAVFLSGLPACYLKLIVDSLRIIDLVRPKSLGGFRLCVQMLLAPHMHDF